MRSKTTFAAAAAVTMVGLSALPAQAATDTPTPVMLADWQMDEPSGATAMEDSSGNASPIAGDIGNEVTTGVPFGDGTSGYNFGRLRPNTPPAHPEHNVVVEPTDSQPTGSLNPAGRDGYAVEVRLRTTNKFGNVVQKGQAGAKGGYWKIQLPQAEPACLFRGPGGVTNAVRAKGKPINGGGWHTIRCVATPDDVTMYLDGVFIGRNTGPTGDIVNSEPVYIGGKGFCDQVKITCDYFGGDIDYVRLEGSSP